MAGCMLPLAKWRLPVFVLAVTCLVPALSAVVVEVREYHSKQVRCMHGGNYFNPVRTCGTQFYARVFTGTVESAVDISDTEKRLVLIPNEVFLGDPASEVTATVNQACMPQELPEIQAGDQWLFYLRSDGFPGDNGSARKLTLPFDSPSKPLSEAEDDIATLRHLARLTEHQSIITGNVERIGETYDKLNPTPVPNHKVVAKGLLGAYVAFTNQNGHFELELPPDTYGVTADTEHGLRETEGIMPRHSTFIANGACLNINLTMLTDGRLAGRVMTAQGKPASHVKVAIVPISPVRPQFSVVADEQGRFDVAGRQPGSYIIGVGLLARYSSREWKERVYYPGVPTREQAKVIELGDGEWRTNIDFQLLPSSATRQLP
jgi:hypothetical protein